MAGSNRKWSWPVFFDKFWSGFGQMMAVFSVALFFIALFADTSSAYFGSAMRGWFFCFVMSAVYGFSEGEDAVRDWREQQGQ